MEKSLQRLVADRLLIRATKGIYVNPAALMKNQDLAAMRPVVEKELLHYEILQTLDDDGLRKHLVFQGGACLRLRRGSDRYDEDLDFAGGKEFTSVRVRKTKQCIETHI